MQIKSLILYTYEGDNHNISGNFSTAMQRTIAFFDLVFEINFRLFISTPVSIQQYAQESYRSIHPLFLQASELHVRNRLWDFPNLC